LNWLYWRNDIQNHWRQRERDRRFVFVQQVNVNLMFLADQSKEESPAVIDDRAFFLSLTSGTIR